MSERRFAFYFCLGMANLWAVAAPGIGALVISGLWAALAVYTLIGGPNDA